MEELQMACYITHALFYKAPSLNMEVVTRALLLGDALDKIDMAFNINEHCCCIVAGVDKIIIEYDGAYYHSGVESAERDMRKTRRILEENMTSLVMRIRDGGLDNLTMDDPRLLQISIPKDVSSVAMKAKIVIEALLEILPQCPATCKCILAHTYTARAPPIERMCVRLQEQSNEVFKRDWTALVALFDGDEDASMCVLGVHGVQSRMSAVVGFLTYLKDDIGMDKDQITTFMCDGLAARMDRPEVIRTFLDYLKDDIGMDTDQIATFMCNGLAAHLGKPTEPLLRDLLWLLKDTMEMSSGDMSYVVGNGSFISIRKHRLCPSLLIILRTMHRHLRTFLPVVDAKIQMKKLLNPEYRLFNDDEQRQRWCSYICASTSLADLTARCLSPLQCNAAGRKRLFTEITGA